MAAEEELHARWFNEIAKEIESGDLVIDAGRFDIKAVELFSTYVQQRLEEAAQPDLCDVHTISKSP